MRQQAWKEENRGRGKGRGEGGRGGEEEEGREGGGGGEVKKRKKGEVSGDVHEHEVPHLRHLLVHRGRLTELREDDYQHSMEVMVEDEGELWMLLL